MKKLKLSLVALLLVVLCAPVARAADAWSLSEDSLRMLVVSAPDSVIAVLDAVEQADDAALPQYTVDLLKAMAYNEKRMFPMVERYARHALANDSIEHHDKEKLNALTLLATAQRFYADFGGSIATLTQAIEIARSLGNTAAEYNILTDMAKTSFSMGQRNQGYAYLDRIIDGGAGSSDARTLANVSAALGVKIVELYADDRFAEGLAEGRRRLDIIYRIDLVGGAPEGFTDQQRAYAYARIASCAERAGKPDEAREAYEAFMATDYAANPMGRVYIMDYLLDSHNYKEVLATTAPLYPMLSQGDTINGDYQSLLTSDARAYAGLGDYRRAYDLAQRATAIGDSLEARGNTARATELAAMFSLNEKEFELAEVKAALQRRHIITYAAVIIAILALVVIVLLVRAFRDSLRRQKMAAKQIDDLLSLTNVHYDERDAGDGDFRVFADMQRTIISQKLFKDANFNRDSIVAMSGLTRARVVSLIDRFTGLKPGDYINKLRVEYSVQLIREHPEWTIDAIAEESGYGRRATYYGNFKKVFGITPAQYRREHDKHPSDQ